MADLEPKSLAADSDAKKASPSGAGKTSGSKNGNGHGEDYSAKDMQRLSDKEGVSTLR